MVSHWVEVFSEVGVPSLALKFKFSEKAKKIDKIFTINLLVCINHQIDDEDFVNFCGLLRKHELYIFTAFLRKVIM